MAKIRGALLASLVTHGLNGTYKLCGAICKQQPGHKCQQPACRGKNRCRLHGGKSTGPKTPEGKKRAAEANLKHGLYTKEAIAENKRVREMLKWGDDLEDIF
jgi:hypothetical protein